ncbi:MAG: flavodoxin family protein [Elusimicrobiota bacterium]
MNKTKVLGISAASTLESRSELLLDSLLDEFLQHDSYIKKIAVRDLNILFCDGLRSCEKTGICKWEDDMQILGNELLLADIVIIATPVYFASVPARLKAIIDRCQVFWARKNILKNFKPSLKKGIFIAVAGRNPEFSHIETVIKAFFSVFNIKLCGRFYLPNTDKLDSTQFTKTQENIKKLIKEVF